MSCEKECYKEANLGEFHDFLPYKCSMTGGPSYYIVNEDSSEMIEVYCSYEFDSIRSFDCDDCICEEIERSQVFLTEKGEEVFRIEYQAFGSPSNLFLGLNHYTVAWIYWRKHVWQDLSTHPMYRDSVKVNNITYYDVIGTTASTINIPGVKDTLYRGYLNREKGIVAFRDTSDVWWNIIKK